MKSKTNQLETKHKSLLPQCLKENEVGGKTKTNKNNQCCCRNMFTVTNTASRVKFFIAQESMQPTANDYFVFLFLAPSHACIHMLMHARMHTNQLRSVLRFEVSTVVKIWIIVFWVWHCVVWYVVTNNLLLNAVLWVTILCSSLVDNYQHFRYTFCLLLQGHSYIEDEGRKFFWNVGNNLTDYTVS